MSIPNMSNWIAAALEHVTKEWCKKEKEAENKRTEIVNKKDRQYVDWKIFKLIVIIIQEIMKEQLPIHMCWYIWLLCRSFCFPACFCTLTFSERVLPNEPSQFCHLFVLGRAIKYSGLVLPWDQTGGWSCIIMPQPALLSTVHAEPWPVVLRMWTQEAPAPSPPHIPQHNVPFSFSPPAFSLPSSSSSSHYLIAVYTYGYFQQVREYKSMWTLSIHDQWRGPALYTKLSRRAGLFYSQPCGFKQIAQTGELKQLLYRSKKCRENR